jgi:hypothetical protein
MAKLELQLPDDYTPSAGELNNFVYLTCKYTCGWQMRQCDLAVCLLMAGGAEAIKGPEGLTKLCEVTCEYLWDHVCGEPDDVDSEGFFNHVKTALQTWYATSTAEERASTE